MRMSNTAASEGIYLTTLNNDAKWVEIAKKLGLWVAWGDRNKDEWQSYLVVAVWSHAITAILKWSCGGSWT